MASPEESTTFLRNDTSASMMASGFLGSAGSDKTQRLYHLYAEQYVGRHRYQQEYLLCING